MVTVQTALQTNGQGKAPAANGQPVRTAALTPGAQSTQKDMCDLIVDYLELLGVEYVFGVPGGHISALFEALDRSEQRGGPRMILSRHETGAANMADGYARETGKLGVCCATTGPGVTNLITGIASSYTDHTPLLVITGQTLLPKFGIGAFQESSLDMMDTAGMLSYCTNYSTVVTHAGQFETKLAKALRVALQPPRGPVHFSIPVDLSRLPAPETLSYPHLAQLLHRPAANVDLAALDELGDAVQETLQNGRRITILVGYDCDGATDAIMDFAERTNARVVTTQDGKTRIDPYHPLVAGVFGYAGHQTARQALTDETVDLVLAVGTTLGQWNTSTWDSALLNEKLVHIHAAPQYFTRSPMARLHVQGTAKTVFEQLLTRLDALEQAGTIALQPFAAPTLPAEAYRDVPAQIEVISPADYQCDTTPIHPQRLVWELMQGHFPAETRFIVDTTNWMPWTIQYFFTKQHQNYRLSSELAAMGWGIGAAVGTAMGAPGTPVVCLAGDGGMLMNGQEITVAVGEGLPVIYLILNDSRYGMVQHRHRQVVKEPLDFAFPTVDFVMMAKAMGADGYTVRTMADWAALDFAAICKRQGPTVLDIYVDPAPMSPQGMY